MKIIIVGGGKSGFALASALSDEGHDVTIVDNSDEVVSYISNALDVICVQGSGTDSDVLKDAGVENADLLIATMRSDETNMICGIAARRLGTKHVIARVSATQYLKQNEFLRETLGLSVVVNPEYECAKEISRIIKFPSASHVSTFSKCQLEIAEYKIAAGSPLIGLQLKDLPRFGSKVLISVVERGNEAIIPRGGFSLRENDKLSVFGSATELRQFFVAIGAYTRKIRDVIIMGGSKIAVYLAGMLCELGMEVTIIEKDRAKCEILTDYIPKANVVFGDATHDDVLIEAGLRNCDAFVAVSGDNSDNIITSIYAKSKTDAKTVTQVTRDHFAEISESAGLDSIVNEKGLMSEQIIRYVRAMCNSEGSSMETLYLLADGKAEAAEFYIDKDAPCTGIPLKDLKLRKDVLIISVIRDNKSLVPDGLSVLEPGDYAIIISPRRTVKNIGDILT